jgi:hypothetical protein
MAGIDIGSLQVRIEAHVNALTRNLSVLTRNTTRAIVNRLATSTPVDTGDAVSNWQVSLNGPPTTRLPPYFPGNAGSTRGENARAMLIAARAVIPNFYVGKGDILYIGNTAPHIEKLNKGSSTQAPAGFVEAAILAGSQHVRSSAPIITGKYTDDVS